MSDMSKLRVRQVGSSHARCRRCGSQARLAVTETRRVRSWSQVLDATFDPAVVRSATCSVCVTTYPILSTDLSVEPAARRRRDTVDEPSRRDWVYPATQQMAAARA